MCDCVFSPATPANLPGLFVTGNDLSLSILNPPPIPYQNYARLRPRQLPHLWLYRALFREC